MYYIIFSLSFEPCLPQNIASKQHRVFKRRINHYIFCFKQIYLITKTNVSSRSLKTNSVLKKTSKVFGKRLQCSFLFGIEVAFQLYTIFLHLLCLLLKSSTVVTEQNVSNSG